MKVTVNAMITVQDDNAYLYDTGTVNIITYLTRFDFNIFFNLCF